MKKLSLDRADMYSKSYDFMASSIKGYNKYKTHTNEKNKLKDKIIEEKNEIS